jgi:hypothetical protein
MTTTTVGSGPSVIAGGGSDLGRWSILPG